MSVLRYPGGKTRAVKIIAPLFPNDMTTLYSPFFGGGAIELYLSQHHPSLQRVIANDKFDLLIQFWQQSKENKAALTQELYSHQGTMDKAKFTLYRQTIKNVQNDIDKAVQFFCINRCSFSGATFSGGFSQESASKRFTRSSIDRLSQLNLEKFEFHCMDACDFLDSIQMDSPTSYIYADPPYCLETSKLYGMSGDLHESFDHQVFAQKIQEKRRWILSYNDCPTVRTLYSNHVFLSKSWSYGMNTSKKSNEVIIVSHDLEEWVNR